VTGNLTTTKKIAGVVGACAVLLGGVACTKTVDGAASAAPIEQTSPSSSSKSSGSSSKSSQSSESSSSQSGEGGGTAQAPDQPYSYQDGTSVKLDAAVEKNDISGLLSSEVGRVLPFHIDNQSEWTLDLSSTTFLADVDCEGSSQYVFPSEPIGGPEQLPPGQSGDYNLYMGLKKDDIGKTCTIEIPFDATGASSVDTATFSMVIS
jgi:hypothetical protein